MTTAPKTKQEYSPVTVNARPLTTTEPGRLKGVGRPAKLVMPPLPHMPLTEAEQNLYDFFIAAYHEEYPDLIATDHILLQLAGYEYIKFLRLIAEELESGTLVSMARQHPGVQFRALLDQLSVTRRARNTRGKPEEDEAGQELKDYFLSMSSPKKSTPSPRQR